MKKISEHLGQIIAALAGVALLVAAVVVFKAPVGEFYNSMVGKEVTVADNVLAGIEDINLSDLSGGGNNASSVYTIIKGAGQTYSTGQLSFTSNAPFSKFAGVKVNDELVDPVNYTVEEGSTIVTFTAEYSQLLAEGDYTIEVLATDGAASAPFDVNITASEPEQTNSLIGTWTTEARDYYAIFNADGTGMFMDGPDESSAGTVMTFTYYQDLLSINWIDYTFTKQGANYDTMDEQLVRAWHVNSSYTTVRIGNIRLKIKLS